MVEKMKKILILNGSFCEEPIIKKAKKMGYYVVTTGNAPELVGHKSADEYIPCDYSDKERVLELVKANNIEGVISCANDFGVLTAAYVAEQMGWKGHDTYENAVLMHHKDKFKEYCREKGIPSPLSSVFTDIDAAKLALRDMEYPVIVKANDLTGGKGINRANNVEEAEKALEIAFSMSRDKHIVVEPYIVGTQHSICVFLMNKKVAVSSSCQCYSFKNPYLIQAETFPSREISGEIKKELEQIIENMAADLNLVDGILNLQLIIRDGKPYIIEMMRRCFGNEALLPYEMVTGFDWNEAYIKAALGRDCSDVAAKGAIRQYCGHFGIMPERNGKLKSCIIDPEIERHLFKKRVMIENGEEVTNYLNERIAYLYYEYDNTEDMNADVLTFNDRIKIEII
jgi:biotin carboxylase